VSIRSHANLFALEEVEEASKGRPTHRLTYDAGRTSPWMIEPYPCDIKLFRQDDGDGCEKVGLLLEIFHEMGNPAKRTSSSITSIFNGCHKVPATPTYAEAVEAINARKSPMEQFLRCHFDLSALTDAEEILAR
jgi:hypothetical protein